MKVQYSPDVNLLYLEFPPGPVAETIELEEFIYVDLDEQGEPLGVEFVDADDFLPFLQRHAGTLDLPRDIAPLAAARRTA